MAAVLLLLGAVPAAAQEDKQTREIRERDRRYYERQSQQEERTPAPQQPGDARAQEARDARVLAFLKEADRLIRDRNHESKTTAHYRVQTDDPRLDPVAAAALLESFRGFFEAYWSALTGRTSYEETSRIFLFYSYFKYNQLLTGKKLFDTFQSSGHYRPYFDVVVIHTDSVPPGDLGGTLVHEAAHQLMTNEIFGPDNSEPPWLSEGIAAYFGYMQRHADGEFVPAAIGGKGISLFRGLKKTAEGSGARRLREVRQSVKKSGAPPLRELVAAEDPSVFYGEGIQERYSLSWLLVHYLFHGEDGALAEPFVAYLSKVASGGGGPEVFFAEIGRTPDELESGFRDYLLPLRTRPAKRR